MSKKIKGGLILLLVTIIIFAFFWFANRFGGGEKVQSEKPLVICQPPNAPPEQPSSAEATAGRQECLWTAHIHAHIGVFQDGKKIPLNFEQGKLERVHTHSDSHILHWHGLIAVDPETKEVKDWSQFSMLQLLKDLGLSVEDGPQIILNGKEVDLSHIWQDGDTIEIRYAK